MPKLAPKLAQNPWFFTGAPTLPRTKLKYLGESQITRLRKAHKKTAFSMAAVLRFCRLNVSQILEQFKKSDTPRLIIRINCISKKKHIPLNHYQLYLPKKNRTTEQRNMIQAAAPAAPHGAANDPAPPWRHSRRSSCRSRPLAVPGDLALVVSPDLGILAVFFQKNTTL